MQHLDEGTIHSWLDGALSAEQAARVEAHVNECAQCAGAVAEARGFIAASSRILTALDNAPHGVIPAMAPKKRVDPMVWRVAATVLVVALGTFAVVRTGQNKQPAANASFDSVLTPRRTAGEEATANATAPENAPSAARSERTPQQTVGTTSKVGAANTPAKSSSAKSDTRTRATEEKPSALGGATGVAARQQLRSNVAASELVAAAAPPAPPAMAPSRLADAPTTDVAAEPVSLRVVATPKVLGERRTLYEIAAGDTVVLSELLRTELMSVVTTGAPTMQPMGKSAAGGRRMAPAIVAAPDTQRGADEVSAQRAATTPTATTANGVTTLTWVDPATGNTMKLSGRHSPGELLGIKRRIEQAKAAAAPEKKAP